MRSFLSPFKFRCLVLMGAIVGALGACPVLAQEEDPSLKPIQEIGASLVAAFNSAQPDAIAALFVEGGELIDEDGTVHQGRAEIQELLKNFFETFPGATMEIETESVRMAGPLAVDDGTRIISDANGSVAMIRFSAVLVNTAEGWKIASIRDFPDETPPTAGEMLQPLAWMIGDWVNEGTDGRVKVGYRWSEDGNFILGEFELNREGIVAGKSSQRIGWDSVHGTPRSWLFDSDGGFSDSTWHAVEDGWLIRSSAVMPDGQSGWATLKLTPRSDSRFQLAGTHRLIGGVLEDDYEITIVKKPNTQPADAEATDAPGELGQATETEPADVQPAAAESSESKK